MPLAYHEKRMLGMMLAQQKGIDMGWGRYLLLGDIGQQFDLSDQKQQLDRVRADLNRTREVAADWKRDIEKLRRENDELKLYLAATIRLLTSKGVLTSSEVKDVVDVLDSEDGVRDGRFTGKIS